MGIKKKFTMKRKHWIILISAGLLFFMVKMCEAEDFSLKNKKEKEDIAELEQMKDDSDSLLTEVIKGIKDREFKYNKELDSLNDLANSGELSKEEIKKLEWEIGKTEELLEIERSKMDSLAPEMRDSVVYNITERDTTVYNIIEKDTIVYNVIYKIDTVLINSDTLELKPFRGDSLGFGPIDFD